MAQRKFYIRAIWDAEANVYVSESDISGLHIETKTLDEFEAEMFPLAIDLIIANHIAEEEMDTLSVRELMPAILWQRPEERVAVAC